MTTSNYFTHLGFGFGWTFRVCPTRTLANAVCGPWQQQQQQQQQKTLCMKINQPKGVPVNCAPFFKFRWKLLHLEVGSQGIC